jgi:TPP-dependent pyruvate/acetoin dehydrogenase alpha subunit
VTEVASSNDTDRLERFLPAELLEMLRRMWRAREFDLVLPMLYTQGLTRGSSHSGIGQEAVAVGACSALRNSDYITSTHRGHGHAIAKGADVRRMMAELLGRADGYCKGKGGSMHIADFSIGMLGANGIVGGGIGLAGGAALSIQMLAEDRVVVCFFGDGAINQGAFHGVANLAAIWNLPVVFVCENNQYAMSARVDQMTSVSELSKRGTAYGIPGIEVDGTHVLEVRSAVEDAVDRARRGDGPSLLAVTCYRFTGHFSGDLMAYRDENEAAFWLERDPVTMFENALVEGCLLSPEDAEGIRLDARSVIQEAILWAKESPHPVPEAAWEDLYA